MKRARLHVRGLVQGVYYRAELRDRARSRSVAGWVRNDADGSVEAVLEGDDEALAELIAWCRRGPRGARVDDVSVSWEEPAGERGFHVVG